MIQDQSQFLLDKENCVQYNIIRMSIALRRLLNRLYSFIAFMFLLVIICCKDRDVLLLRQYPFGCFFLSSVYQHFVRPHLQTAQNVVDDDIDVGYVDLAVAVDIANAGPAVTVGARYTGVTATAATIDDDVNHVVDVGNVDFAVAVYVSKEIEDSISID